MKSQTSGPRKPTWLTVGACSLILSIATAALTTAVKFGKQESDLAAALAQNESLTAEQERLSKLIGDWRTAYEAQQSLLQTANNRLHALENDRCNELVKEIRYLKDYISTPGAYGYSEDKVPDLREVLTGYQATLRACYASRL